MKPIRIQRKRVKGYDMQADSISRNGLPGVYVGRPGKWGNPFVVGKSRSTEHWSNPKMTVEQCLAAYRRMIVKLPTSRNLEELRGKNLACWCAEGTPCHADILLELANS